VLRIRYTEPVYRYNTRNVPDVKINGMQSMSELKKAVMLLVSARTVYTRTVIELKGQYT
jgi:hypothetical protein